MELVDANKYLFRIIFKSDSILNWNIQLIQCIIKSNIATKNGHHTMLLLVPILSPFTK